MSDFWSNRRKAVEAEAEAEANADAARVQEAELAELEGLDDSEILERLGLPDPDSIGPGDDVAAFMAKAVPRHIRTRALRRLWVSNPLLANLDGLADYAEDFTGNGLNGRALQTTYEVGKGLAAHVQKQIETAEQNQIQVKQSDLESRPSDDESEKNLAEPVPDVEPLDGIPPDSDPGVVEETVRPRMRFSFEEDDRSERPNPAGSGGPIPGGSASG
ncbi:MAG: DUF3306 domain-containing protein [Pseudomonadota bacterium]